MPKTLPKRGLNPSKIDAKNVLFFHTDFFGFGIQFWRVWGLFSKVLGSCKWNLRAFPGWQTFCHQLVLHHCAIRKRKVVEILPSHGTSASNVCASLSWQQWARCSRSGWPAVSPGGLHWNWPIWRHTIVGELHFYPLKLRVFKK